MPLLWLLICNAILLPVHSTVNHVLCSLSSSDQLIVGDIPTTFEFNVPYTVTVSSNSSLLLPFIMLDIDPSVNISNSSVCRLTNRSASVFRHRTEFILTFEQNTTKSKCVQLRLHSLRDRFESFIAKLCSNSSTADNSADTDDQYDKQSYMRTSNTTEIVVFDNFNWLIFASPVQQIWHTHEGMRLSRECDAADDGRVAIFSNPRGKRRLISRPIDITDASLLYMRLGSGTCPPPAPMDPPFQLLITSDCVNYTNWRSVYSQKILPGIEHVTVPLVWTNFTNASNVCLKLEQAGEKFAGGGAWFIDDLLIVRSRAETNFLSDNFQALRPANWYRLAGGQLKTCDHRLSMVFESNADIRTELGATTIDFSLSASIDYERDALFYLTKNQSIDWTQWNATGFLDLNSTCTAEDVITFNGENYRQLCSPMIELGRLDSIRFTLSTEPCVKRNKLIPTPEAGIFLSVLYNGSTAGYTRTIRRILLREIQTEKTFHVRLDEFRHSAQSFGRLCLSQYHQSSGKHVDVWSVRDFLAFPLLPTNITHYIQLSVNTKCSAPPPTNGVTNPNLHVEYSLDFGKHWHELLHPCYLDLSCSRDVQHIYSSHIVLPSPGWHRVILPLPLATLQQNRIRFRISTPPTSTSSYSTSESWAIEKVFIGQCVRACSGHGWCQFNSCRCDPGFSGDFCEKSKVTLIHRASYLFDQTIGDQTDLITYQGGRLNYKCNIISQGKAMVFSKTGPRFLRLSNINGSSPKILEFTFRLGSANPQCFGTSPTDLSRDLKSILLLLSCSNGAHWTIVDLLRIGDVLAPDFGTMSRMIFSEKLESDKCLIEWRQMNHGGDNQDVWAIDDISIREIPSLKTIKRNLNTKSFQTKAVYIRPGYILSFQLQSVNRKEAKSSIDLKDIRLQINASQIDLANYPDLFSYQSENSTLTFVVLLPQSIWYTYTVVNLTIVATKKFDLNAIHLGVPCENHCWLNGLCLEGICTPLSVKLFNQSMVPSFDEDDLRTHRINVIDDELLLPFIDSTDLTSVHFQTRASLPMKSDLLFQCSPNGGVKWFEVGRWTEEKDILLKDHYVSLLTICQTKRTLFRWKNSSVQLINLAFVRSHSQHYFMDQSQTVDLSKWLYPTYSANVSGLNTHKITTLSNNKTLFQLISTAITLKQHDYILMIDMIPTKNGTELQVDYSLDNVTWHLLIEKKELTRSIHRFAVQIPSKVLGKSILVRLQSFHAFFLNHIYVGPPCPANCYGQGKCIWKKQQAICKCDHNQSSEAYCLTDRLLLSSLHENFENKSSTSIWAMSPHKQITHRCYNRLSKTTPYLCFLPNNQTQRAYAKIGPFQPIKYVAFKFGLQYVGVTNCPNQILFQYSYDNGLQWYTKTVLDVTKNAFETFDDLKINMNLQLRWIEENDQSCLMWNLRSVSVRTKSDLRFWFENNLHLAPTNATIYEAQTWEFSSIAIGSLLQFDLQMFPTKKSNETDWTLSLEVSSDVNDGWSNWIPLISPCNQTNLYCEDRIGSMGSSFLASSYLKLRNITLPIPDIYAHQDVRFRWTASQANARFMIKRVYVGADCPWFCSGHGQCLTNGCQCDPGYVLPFCSPDPLTPIRGERLAMDITASLTHWSETWGYEKCSAQDERLVFSKAGTRGLISPEMSLAGMRFLRIELHTCANRSQTFLEPILVQHSLNNGILWKILTSISYRLESPGKPWLIELPKDEPMQGHLVRLRLFQRVTTKWASNWILNAFEIIPDKLPQRWFGTNSTFIHQCHSKDSSTPIEVYSTVDIELNETSFLTFQLDANRCANSTLSANNHSELDLEYSVDYGQTWSMINQPPSIASNPIDVLITQPLRAMKTEFYLPLYAFYPSVKFLRLRWLASNFTIANRWQLRHVTVRSECEVLCELDACHSKCSCSQAKNCSSISTRKKTFFEQFNQNSSALADMIMLPALNLVSTRFLEFHVHTSCKESRSFSLSLEYSRNMGLTWQLFRYLTLNLNRSSIVHDDLLDDMNHDGIQIRFVFSTTVPKCWKIEQIIVSGSSLLIELIYKKFEQSTSVDSNLFVSFGSGTFNGTYLVFPTSSQSNATSNEIITDELLVLSSTVYIQLALVPLSFNSCLTILFSFSSDYGHTWLPIDDGHPLLFDHEKQPAQPQILTWQFPSTMIGSSQVRFRIRFEDKPTPNNKQPHLLAVSELYIGSNCINACNGHGMCTPNRQCRCNRGWTNSDCSLPLIRFPHEIDLLTERYFTSHGMTNSSTCGRVFNHTCQRMLETNYIDVHREHTFVHLELAERCATKNLIRRNGDGWIRLEYREVNAHHWMTLSVLKGPELKITHLLPPIVLQLRLIQDPPMNSRSPWSIEQFHVFHFHLHLQWSAADDLKGTKWNATFLTLTQSKEKIVHQTKDVQFRPNLILQFELNSSHSIKDILQYSSDLGLTWLKVPNEKQLENTPIRFNQSFYRFTVPFQMFISRNSSIRFQLTLPIQCHLAYLYIGDPCPMNCHGQSRCNNGECSSMQSVAPLGDFRETFDRDTLDGHWLQLEAHRQKNYRLHWTTAHRQAITRPIDLRPLRALKWTYHLEKMTKTCQTSIYVLISTDGTLTWSVLHRLDLPLKGNTSLNSSAELSVELQTIHRHRHVGQFRWFQTDMSNCSNFTWSLSRVVGVKSLNIYFLTDYFYTISSSRANWVSIEGALLAQPDQCNNNLPSLIFNETDFSAVTVPILIQSYYVLVFQFNTECHRNDNAKTLECGNVTSVIDYRTDSASTWVKLADIDDLACRTSLINRGFFNMHTIKLPAEAYSSGTQFRWIGTQTTGVQWSLHSLFVGECPEYCHDRGLCTVSGCQCAIGYTGTACEKYIGKEPLPTRFNETFDDPSAASVNGPHSNNWIKLSGDGHIRHVCDETVNNNTNDHLRGQALHFGAGCGCGHVEAITRELNISQAKRISFAFHVTTEDNCVLTNKNITVALEWTFDEGIAWSRLMTMYNHEHAQFFNVTLPTEMLTISKKRQIGGVRLRWTQVERAAADIYWSIDSIRLE